MDAAKALSLRIKEALKIAEAGTVDGASHKMWVIGYEDEDDGPNTYEWDTGVEP